VGILITGVDLQTNASASMHLFVNDKRVKSTLVPAPQLGRQILTFNLGLELLKTDDPGGLISMRLSISSALNGAALALFNRRPDKSMDSVGGQTIESKM
jgi:hypothetical protein